MFFLFKEVFFFWPGPAGGGGGGGAGGVSSIRFNFLACMLGNVMYFTSILLIHFSCENLHFLELFETNT